MLEAALYQQINKSSGDFVTCLFLKRAPSTAFWSHPLVLLIFSSFPSVLLFVIPNTWSWSISLSLHHPIPKKGNAKECSNYRTIALLSHASKVMLKFLHILLGFSNVNSLMFKLVLEKAEEPEIKLPTSAGSWRKQESSKKYLFLLYWLCQSL